MRLNVRAHLEEYCGYQKQWKQCHNALINIPLNWGPSRRSLIFFSKCTNMVVTMHLKKTHFEKKNESALNFGPN